MLCRKTDKMKAECSCYFRETTRPLSSTPCLRMARMFTPAQPWRQPSIHLCDRKHGNSGGAERRGRRIYRMHSMGLKTVFFQCGILNNRIWSLTFSMRERIQNAVRLNLMEYNKVYHVSRVDSQALKPDAFHTCCLFPITFCHCWHHYSKAVRIMQYIFPENHRCSGCILA